MIAIADLCVRVGAFRLDQLSLTVEAGEYAVLMGRTGCGKTTLLECVSGLRQAASGSIHLHGQDVTRLSPAQRDIGYVPQDLALFPTLRVRDHLAFALELRRKAPHEIEQRVAEMAGLLGIGHLLSRFPQGLSGGEAQRVALGRALAFRPSVLLLDEPLAALDDTTRTEMMALLRTVQRQTHVTTLHVTHSSTEAKNLADRLFLLDNGKIREAAQEERNHEPVSTDAIRKGEA
jgi:ABC-type sugar transport system ATPase subunit